MSMEPYNFLGCLLILLPRIHHRHPGSQHKHDEHPIVLYPAIQITAFRLTYLYIVLAQKVSVCAMLGIITYTGYNNKQ